MSTARKVSLSAFLRRMGAGREPQTVRALHGLVGLPGGGWGETRRAILEVDEALPRKRSFTAAQLIAASLTLDYADRYAWKE